MLEALKKFIQDPSKPVYGTCAGMILLAAEDGVAGGRKPQKGLDGITGMNVWRNLYGSELLSTLRDQADTTDQLESFEAPLVIPALSNPTEPFPAIFIRAPALHSLTSTNIKTQRLASLPDDLAATPPPSDTPLGPANTEDLKVVMLRQGRKLATSFHPELSPDYRIHELFLRMVLEARD
jgi:5'-phosphate synthase pdxT subunit